jgi:hypothetical protein
VKQPNGRPGAPRRLSRRVARKLRSTLAGGLRRTDRIVRTATRPLIRHRVEQRGVEIAYLAVLDGHTLNLNAILRDDAELTAAHVTFGGTDHTSPAVLARDRHGRAAVEATIVLGDRPGRVPLAPGSWPLELLLVAPDGRSRRVPVLAAGAPEPRGGGKILAEQRCPDTGTWYRLGSNEFGVATVRVTRPKPLAEVESAPVTNASARIRGRVIGVQDGAAATFEFTAREVQAVVVDAPIRRGRFDVEVPLARLAAAVKPGEGRFWKVRMTTKSSPAIRLGRTLTDVGEPHLVFTAPERLVALDSDEFALVRASYTENGQFQIACRRVERGLRT